VRSANYPAIVAVLGLLVGPLATACSESGSPGPTSSQIRDQVFLDVVSGPMRDRFSDSVLLAEGRKVCEAKSQGQSRDQIEQMVTQDLNLDPRAQPGELIQFMGAVDGFC
jgi:hypothetical protein